MSSSLCRSAWDVSKSKFLMSVAAAVMLAGCSSEADRFTSGTSGADPVTTASVPNRVTAANVGVSDEISSSPITSAPSQPPSYDYSKSYSPPSYRQPAAAPQPEIASAPPAAGAGGTVTVGPGMTLYSVARANNVSVSELAAANGIQPPYSVRTGQQLRIPGGGGAQSQTASFAEPESTPIVEPKPGTPAAKAQQPFKQGPSVTDSGTGATHTVASGETLFSLGRTYGVSPFAIAEANGLPNDAQLTMGQKVRIPDGGTSRTAKAPAPEPETDGDDAEIAAAPENTANAVPTRAAPEEPAASSSGQVAEQAPIAGAPGMRWPVRGKVISGFGPKANGLKNEGINIAVPEGTSIRAADSGVVAYAGNELKGYGNLVLIRHENGYVTAYAHAKELFVKRGDTVKRGDVIAKAGQTGSVSSPQLHFEVRKGATALDPMKFLTSSTAAN
jgi:murein DD-endopeptidase MepM/ murein hydrolase activator NlpD